MRKRKLTSGLEALPGIGPSLARDLRELGYREPADLHGRDPEMMYAELCELRARKIDRCVLYAFRCAVNAVDGDRRDPRLLKWWNWKDAAPAGNSSRRA
jgi:hypothetical protein